MECIKLRKKWSNVEKFLIWLGYHANVPYKELSAFLGRTLTSVNKVVQRHQIKSKSVTLNADIHARYVALLANKGKSTTHLARALTESFPEVLSQSPWRIEPENLMNNSAALAVVKGSERHTTVCDWHDWQEVINYLKRQGLTLTSVSVKANDSPLYMLNGKIMTEKDVFIFVNRRRHNQGLSPYLIPGMTFIH